MVVWTISQPFCFSNLPDCSFVCLFIFGCSVIWCFVLFSLPFLCSFENQAVCLSCSLKASLSPPPSWYKWQFAISVAASVSLCLDWNSCISVLYNTSAPSFFLQWINLISGTRVRSCAVILLPPPGEQHLSTLLIALDVCILLLTARSESSAGWTSFKNCKLTTASF